MRAVEVGRVKELAHHNFPLFLRQRAKVVLLDKWHTGRQYDIDMPLKNNRLEEGGQFHGRPFSPRTTNDEHKDLESRAPSAWARVIVAAVAQAAYVDGVRRPKDQNNMEVWDTWQKNRWDAKQIPLHRAAAAHGLAFSTALRAADPFTGKKTVAMRPVSAKRMAGFYDVEDDEWPTFAIEADQIRSKFLDRQGWTVSLYDDRYINYLSCERDGEELRDWTVISREEHGSQVTPVTRYANQLDLDGNTMGEIEPYLPILRRIDQDTFDRLIVQRYGAWMIRYIAGMAKPTNADEERAAALTLRIQDLLVSDNPNAKFGTLQPTEMKGFIDAHEQDLRDLAAVSQTAPHHILGISSNMQPEALAAAEAAQLRKAGDFRTFIGEAHEQNFRLVAHLTGNAEEARAFDMQVRWRDTESRSLVQSANALSLLATNLGVPTEMLWERIPGWTDYDSERAKNLVMSGDAAKLISLLEAATVDVAKTSQTGGSENDEIVQ